MSVQLSQAQILHRRAGGWLAGSIYFDGGAIGVAPGAYGKLGIGQTFESGKAVRLYYLGQDSGTGLQVSVKAYNSSDGLIGTVCTDTVAAATRQSRSASGTVPANTASLRIEPGAGGTNPLLDHADVLVGDLNVPAFSNLECNATAGWTTASGAWGVSVATKLAGTSSINCTASGELYQQQSLAGGYDGADCLVWLSCWLNYAAADDQLSVILEARDSGGGVQASLTLPKQQDLRLTPIVGEWMRRSGYLTLPSSVAGGALRIRVIGVVGAGSVGPLIDNIHCVVAKP